MNNRYTFNDRRAMRIKALERMFGRAVLFAAGLGSGLILSALIDTVTR